MPGVKGSGGIPYQRALNRPHPGGQLVVPEGFDGLEMFMRANPSSRLELRGINNCDDVDFM